MSVETIGLSALSFLMGALFGSIGGWFAYRGLSATRRGYTLWRSDPTPVEDARTVEGLVELEGKVVPAGERLEAPFTGTDCLAYRWRVETRRRSGDNNRWVHVASGDESVPFRLEDDSGRILVDPEGAELSIGISDTTNVGRGETAEGRIAAFLESVDVEPGKGGERNLGPLTVETGDRRRYREGRIEPGDTVYVYGPVERDFTVADDADDVTAAIRDEADDGLFLVSDADESSTVRRFLWKGIALSAFGCFFLVFALPVLLGGVAGMLFGIWQALV